MVFTFCAGSSFLKVRSRELHGCRGRRWKQTVIVLQCYTLSYHREKHSCTRTRIVLSMSEINAVYQQGVISLSKKQFGFKRGTSTETALHKIAHTIERRIAMKGYILGTFLDIEGAFDNVSFKAISDAINSSPADKSTARWIINMVNYRHLTVTHKGITKRVRIRRGCPQGGIISQFLWELVVDDLLKFSAKEIPGYLQAFADDLVTLAEGSNTGVIWQRTQKTINTIEKWCDTKGLMFTWNRNWTMRPISV